jgi:L-lactate dehydrogenase complex protein LldG
MSTTAPPSDSGNLRARDAILERIGGALGRAPTQEARHAAQTYIEAHAAGPRPAMPGDHAERFVLRSRMLATTVERIDTVAAIPAAVARYLDALVLPPALAQQRSRSGVCWSEFAGLEWSAAGLPIENRPTTGGDRLAITGCFCAIAETGTLVVTSAAGTPTASTLLPDTHVAVVRADRIVAGMEDAFALLRREHGAMPRAVNLISGPSRTGDIEQTIVLGAHGPFRMHVLLLPAAES